MGRSPIPPKDMVGYKVMTMKVSKGKCMISYSLLYT